AVAATRLAEVKLGLNHLGAAAGDLDEVVALTEEAHDVAPSSATVGDRINALLTRAHQTLARREPAFAALATKSHQRSLGRTYLIAVALGREAKLREAVLDNPDFRSAVGLLKESNTKFPDSLTSWEWAVFQAADPEEAARIAKALREDEVGRLERSIELRLS